MCLKPVCFAYCLYKEGLDLEARISSPLRMWQLSVHVLDCTVDYKLQDVYTHVHSYVRIYIAIIISTMQVRIHSSHKLYCMCALCIKLCILSIVA